MVGENHRFEVRADTGHEHTASGNASQKNPNDLLTPRQIVPMSVQIVPMSVQIAPMSVQIAPMSVKAMLMSVHVVLWRCDVRGVGGTPQYAT